MWQEINSCHKKSFLVSSHPWVKLINLRQHVNPTKKFALAYTFAALAYVQSKLTILEHIIWPELIHSCFYFTLFLLFHFIPPHAVEDPMHPVWSLNYYLTPIIDYSHREGCNYWNLCRIASASCYQPWNTGWQTSTSPESIAFGLDRLF